MCTCIFMCFHMQALAGPRVSHHLHHRPAWYAEAACGIVAFAAQLPPRDDLLFRRPGTWSPETEDHLPQKPHTGGKEKTLTLTLPGQLIFALRHELQFVPSLTMSSVHLTLSAAVALGYDAFKCQTHLCTSFLSFTSVTLRSTLLMAPWRTSLFTTC